MRLGIIGSGQLAQMMAHLGPEMGISFAFATESHAAAEPVEGLGDIILLDECNSAEDLYVAMGKPDVVTVEKEAVDVSLLTQLEHFCRVAPNPKAVSITQNREREKTFCKQLNIPTAGFRMIESIDELKEAIEELDFPVIVKSVEEGYDGKNQWRIKTASDIDAFADNYDNERVIVEQWIPFDGEVSMLAARSVSGTKTFYPLTQNRHENGILLTSKTPPKNWTDTLESKAQVHLDAMLEQMDYVGVLAVEFFVVGNDLLVNELAPRVHNSGHWTQQGCSASQFENHLRAVFGLPLGNSKRLQNTAMLNLLGVEVTEQDMPNNAAVLHWYNKVVKPGRKVGHINIVEQDGVDVNALLDSLEKAIYKK